MKKILAAAFMSLFVIAARAESIAFVNVNVIPMTSEQVIAAQTVVVSDGVIQTIGDFDITPVPADALVVDGTDRFLLPGLTEMHGHVPGTDSDNLDRVLALYVANGVTTVRGMLGQASHLELRQRLADGEVLGPRLITSGPSFNGRSVDGPQAAERMVREQHAAGYDFLKIHPGLTREEFDAIAATANEVGMPFAGHVPEDVGIERALDAGIATIDHLDGYMQALVRPNEDPSGGVAGFFGVFIADQVDEDRIADIARLTAAAGTSNVATESLFVHVTSPALPVEELARRPEMKYVPAATVAQWRQAKESLLNDPDYDADTALRAIRIRRAVLRALQDAGAGLLLGSDSPQIFNVPGFALHYELAYLVEAGIEPLEALRAGTVNTAAFFRIEDRVGTIQEGMEADLLLLDANPLADIGATRRIHGVLLRDRWLSRTELDRLLDAYER